MESLAMSERFQATSLDAQYSLEHASGQRETTVALVDKGMAFSLRLAPELASSARDVAGFDLTASINQLVANGSNLAARLGPDEWFLLAPHGDSEPLMRAISAGLVGHFHSLVDVSSRQMTIFVSGTDAVKVLNSGLPLDLDTAAFPPGSATRTVLGKVEIVMMRTGMEPVYRIECWRSYAPYVYAFLEEAAAAVHAQQAL
jgi:sarcosine oxidase, subunit gamma